MDKLHIIDRYALLMMIPGQGEYAQMRVWLACRDKLDFTANEVMQYGLFISKDGIQWGVWDRDDQIDPKTNKPRLVINIGNREDTPITTPLNAAEEKICKFANSLKKIQRKQGLIGIQVELYDAFVGGEPVDMEFLAAEAEKQDALDEEKYLSDLHNEEVDAEKAEKKEKKAAKPKKPGKE